MKTKLLLLRGLGASALLMFGFARTAERLDPIQDHASLSSSHDVLMRTCDQCTFPDDPPPGGDDPATQRPDVFV
jgi:hypothetical protein